MRRWACNLPKWPVNVQATQDAGQYLWVIVSYTSSQHKARILQAAVVLSNSSVYHLGAWAAVESGAAAADSASKPCADPTNLPCLYRMALFAAYEVQQTSFVAAYSSALLHVVCRGLEHTLLAPDRTKPVSVKKPRWELPLP